MDGSARRPWHSRVFLLLLLTGIAALVAVDIHLAAQTPGVEKIWLPLDSFPPLRDAGTTRVAVVRSNDPALADPTAVTRDLSYAQVLAMTRHAVELAGGLEGRLHPGDRVLIKPCLVTPDRKRNTDIRVTKAVIRLVHEATGGDADIVLGEGSAYPAPEDMEYVHRFGEPQWQELWDAGGYERLLTDPDMEGIGLRLCNLNGPREDLVLVDVPNGGYTGYRNGKVWVHKEVLNADFHITVPTLKLHTFTGITVGLKNNIGLYPGHRYGFPKELGVGQDDFRNYLVHQVDAPRDWVDEEIVDIALLAGIDFAVVDAIDCSYGSYRRNAVIAGADVVAVDHVATRLMGMNPDDICHITLAAMAGLGINDPARIEILGTPIDASWFPFRKQSRYSTDFGQSNRTWLLRGPFAAVGPDDPIDQVFIGDEAAVRLTPLDAEWSPPIYFQDDRIDLGAYYEGAISEPVVAYAFAYFDAPVSQEAEMWVGSDEDMRVYLNGEQVYEHRGGRAYGSEVLVVDKPRVRVLEGENTLLVKVVQSAGSFDFALNICKPELDPDIDGNRVSGLTFRARPAGLTAVADEAISGRPTAARLGANYPNPFNANTVIPFSVPGDVGTAVALLRIYDVLGQPVRTLVHGNVAGGDHVRVWDGNDDQGVGLASGSYLCRLEVGSYTQSRKLLLIR